MLRRRSARQFVSPLGEERASTRTRGKPTRAAYAVATLRACRGFMVAVSLGACAIVDQIDPRIDATNRQTARARDQAVLLNIVRANHNVPLNFVAFSRVSGTQSAAISLASPTFLLGPATQAITSIAKQEALFNNTTLSTSGATNNAFDLT